MSLGIKQIGMVVARADDKTRLCPHFDLYDTDTNQKTGEQCVLWDRAYYWVNETANVTGLIYAK